jgi:hypothetical protein
LATLNLGVVRARALLAPSVLGEASEGAAEAPSERKSAIAASYSAVRRNAARARLARVASPSAPPVAFSSSSTAAYCDGSVSTATLAWFLAAARIIVGPPTSICSMASARRTPGRATVCSKG